MLAVVVYVNGNHDVVPGIEGLLDAMCRAPHASFDSIVQQEACTVLVYITNDTVVTSWIMSR